MRLIGLAVILTLGVSLAPLVTEAQQAGKVYRVGYLSIRPALVPEDKAFLACFIHERARPGSRRAHNGS